MKTRRLLLYLSKNSDTRFKIKELALDLHVKKHKYRDLLDTLRVLHKEKKIRLKSKRYSFSEISEKEKKVIGKFDARPLSKDKSFAFVLTPDFDVYVSAEDILNAYHGDKVLVKVFQRGEKKYGVIVKIIERANVTVIGTVVKYKDKYLGEPDNLKLHTDFLVRKVNGAVPGDKVMIKICDWGR